ncbi:MAG: hypothetical protein H9847_09670 [Candidatus Anaerobiospirillum pullicola]|uniref:Wadjet protein JetD C-terminal domain-containing protein n=1 Tax=Candidatus Anaerobiospirillum pullicola TaxID=2838451 RepID=A0A948TI66_9GAMM|nr:hypothetical protein [Candidatus Anaerobiospirillum pullicola]
MLTYQQLRHKLLQKYQSNKGFADLLNQDSYPREFSLQPPALTQATMEQLREIKQWQQSFEQSPLRPFLIKKQKGTRSGVGQQNILCAVSFPHRQALEHFIASHLCPQATPPRAQGAHHHQGSTELGVFKLHSPAGSFGAFDEICEYVLEPLYPALRSNSAALARRQEGLISFVRRKPWDVSLLGTDFLCAMFVVDYMASLPATPHVYLRQVALPHLDTKFIETHYRLLDELFSLCLAPERRLVTAPFIGGDDDKDASVASGATAQRTVTIPVGAATAASNPDTNAADADANAKRIVLNDEAHPNTMEPALALPTTLPQEQGLSGFTRRWGFQTKPEMVRLRFLDEQQFTAQSSAYLALSREIALEINSLEQLQVPFAHVIICENEMSYLCLPPISNTIAIFGSGYAVAHLGPITRLHRTDIIYWGDLDTHGFAILNALRLSMLCARLMAGEKELRVTQLKVRSMLMDRATLKRHQEYVVTEKEQRVTALPCLLQEEQCCYQELIAQRHGQHLRLEQERIPYDEVLLALQALLPEEHVEVPEHLRRDALFMRDMLARQRQ